MCALNQETIVDYAGEWYRVLLLCVSTCSLAARRGDKISLRGCRPTFRGQPGDYERGCAEKLHEDDNTRNLTRHTARFYI